MSNQPKEKLFTSSFIFACFGNFFLFFGFYLLLPILPLYLIETFGTNKSTVGIILSCYTLSALLIRPFSAFFADLYNRKPLYLWSYFFFVFLFVSYPVATSIALFFSMRVLHGLAFGSVTTTGNTLIVDIMPPSRRGEGLGYFGMANNLAMATGPMMGLFLHDMIGSYNFIFYTALFSGVIGLACATMIKNIKKEKVIQKEAISLDRFFLSKGVFSGISLLLLGIPYGMITTYVALYGKEIGINKGIGLFFSLMAVGLIISRLFAGKLVDRGKLVKVISVGSIITLFSFLLFSYIGKFNVISPILPMILFYTMALIFGIGYGMMFPAYNTLFVNLAPHNRRATASSTYLTSWDIGVGIGLILGGSLADLGGFSLAFFFGFITTAISTFIFVKKAGPHFEKNKLR